MSEKDRVKKWLSELKESNTGLEEAIKGIEPFLSENGFAGKEYEDMVQKMISTIEKELKL